MKYRALTAVAVALSAGIVFELYDRWPRPQITSSLGPPPVVSVMGAYKDAPDELHLGVFKQRVESTPIKELVPTGADLRTTYEEWKSGTPVQRVRAYELVEKCLEASRDPNLAFERTARCGNLEPGQIAGRLESLEVAAEKGARRAWYIYQQEADGYFSEGMVPNTPETQEKVARYLEIAIEHGDPRAIQTVLPFILRAGKPEHAAKAIELQVAVLIGFKQEFGQPPPLSFMSNPIVANLAKQLPPDAVTAAIKAGVERSAKAPQS